MKYAVVAAIAAGSLAWFGLHQRSGRVEQRPGPRSGPEWLNAPLGKLASLPLLQGPWTERVDDQPAHPDSSRFIDHYGSRRLYPEFGFEWPPDSGQVQGFPYVVAGVDTPLVLVRLSDPYGASDHDVESPDAPEGRRVMPAPPGEPNTPKMIYAPIPEGSPVEVGPDGHLIVVYPGRSSGGKSTRAWLYEFYGAEHKADGWQAHTAVRWDMTRPAGGQRPEGMTSVDAAGLPILPGLIRYDEAASGRIEHALRMSVPNNGPNPGYYVPPASHTPNNWDKDPFALPMGARLRLKADFDTSGYSKLNRAILDALKVHGAIIADGTEPATGWTLNGDTDPRWDGDDLLKLRGIDMGSFEVVGGPQWQPGFEVRAASKRIKAGQPVAIEAKLTRPGPRSTSVPVEPWVIPPGGDKPIAGFERGFEPWSLFLAADKPSGRFTFTPPEPGRYEVRWNLNSPGRKPPEPLMIEAVR